MEGNMSQNPVAQDPAKNLKRYDTASNFNKKLHVPSFLSEFIVSNL
jgi:hypothetical protein